MATLFSTCFKIDHFIVDEDYLWKRMPQGERVLVTKLPGDEILARVLLWLDRRLWFVFLLRDPRDLIVSEHGSKLGKYWSNLFIWQRSIAVYDKLKHHRRFITVRYEDLVSDPDKVQRELLARMGFLEAQIPFSEYHKYIPQEAAQSKKLLDAMRGIREISTGSIGAWRRHLPRVKAQIDSYKDLPAKLIELNYEPDDKWLQALEGVRPDHGMSLRQDYIPPRRRFRIFTRRLKAYGIYVLRRYVPSF